MATCAHCGNPLSVTDQSCPRCGYGLHHEHEAQESGSARGSRFYPDDSPTGPIPVVPAGPQPESPGTAQAASHPAEPGWVPQGGQASKGLSAGARAVIAACYLLVLGLVVSGVAAFQAAGDRSALTITGAGEGYPGAFEGRSDLPGPTIGPREGAQPNDASGCTHSPTFVMMDTEVTSYGGLRVALAVDTQCARRQLLDGSSVRIALLQQGESTAEVASSWFDFSASPLLIDPAHSSTTWITFPAGSYVIPNGSYLTARCSATTRSAAGTGTGSTRVELRATSAASADPVAAAETALQRQVRLDAADVAALAGSWVPQLASGRPGIVVDGETFDFPDMLERHLSIRLAYPDARLLYSGDWSVFSDDDFYVTVYAEAFDTAKGALAWCEAENRGPDHCFAKKLSHTATVTGSTRYQE